MEPLSIVVIAGTSRVQRKSVHAARLVADIGRSYENVKITFVDPAEFSLPGDGNDPEGKDPRYSAITEQADAFFIVSPEYNHSFPGSLKRLLDSELASYNHKPVALAGASSGHWGGLRAVEALVGTVRELGLVVTAYDVYFPMVQDLFDEANALKPEHRAGYEKSIGKAFDELIWFAHILKSARNQ